MKLIDKFKKEVKANMKASTTKKKHLFTFKKEHFKEKRAQSNGIGLTDLKPTPFNLYMGLLKKHGAKLETSFKGTSVEDMEVSLHLKP